MRMQGRMGERMRVLWVCNIMLPMIAEQLHRESSNKEGWLSGLASVALGRRRENGIELAVAFPAPRDLAQSVSTAASAADQGEGTVEQALPRVVTCGGVSVCHGKATGAGWSLDWYGFQEDVQNAHVYSEALEPQMRYILGDFRPDIVHCFGTEYAHTLAVCRVFPAKSRILLGIQGLCTACAGAYFADIPQKVIHSATLRDRLKRDDLMRQQKKFARRGEMEQEAIRLAGNVTGRTAWDRHYTGEWNPKARYFEMNETLRSNFYQGKWSPDRCEPHAIFLSQGDYPLKGLHYMLLALPKICAAYPDTKVYVAGNSIVNYKSWKEKLKISAYGRYLRDLIEENKLEERLQFLGRLSAEEMKAQYLRSGLFVCCSTVENSPNSLGEAMLLGMPCVSADVGGVASIFTGGHDGILYEGYPKEGSRRDAPDLAKRNADNLADAVIAMWSDPEKRDIYTKNAREHAKRTHDPEANYRRLLEIYEEILRTDVPQFVFVSNYINHHQIPFCQAMLERLNGSFAFIQTEPMEEERTKMGWDGNHTPPFVVKYYEEPEKCQEWIDTCEVLLFGGVDEERYVQRRLQEGKPLLRYSERLYKTGQWKAVSPRGLRRKYLDHTRYRKAPVYLLCAGAYVADDFHIVRAYPGKMFCWGYFPETKHYDVDKLLSEKGYPVENIPGNPADKILYLLWSGRMIDWKHPELALETARYLKAQGLDFHLDMIGGGALEDRMKALCREYQLEDRVSFPGFLKPDQVRTRMEQADIYLLTSDRQEGWGAVANESMNSACAVVLDHMIGAAPYLIRQGENGFLYRDGDKEELFRTVERLARDKELRSRIGRSAYETIRDEWNAGRAAEELLKLAGRLFSFKEDLSWRESREDRDLTNTRKNADIAGGSFSEIDHLGTKDSGGSGEGNGRFTPCQPAPVIPEKAMFRYLTGK